MILFLVLSLTLTPVTYNIDKKLPHKKAIKKTFNQLNKRGGNFKFVKNKSDSNVIIARGYEYGGWGWHKDGNAYIGTYGVRASKKRYLKTIVHEVFHTQGLKHNNNPLSIMYFGSLENASVLDSDIVDLQLSLDDIKCKEKTAQETK